MKEMSQVLLFAEFILKIDRKLLRKIFIERKTPVIFLKEK